MTAMNHPPSYLIYMDDISLFFFKAPGGEGKNSFLAALPDLGVGAVRVFAYPAC